MKRVLVVDDDPAFAQVLQRRLQRQGLEVEQALSPQEAWQILLHFTPDGVLLDLRLGQESGLLMIQQLRQRLPLARIVLLTGFASISSAVQAIKLGADDYLSKPADTQAILQALVSELKAETTREPGTPVMSAERAEWEHIQQVLSLHGGNISAAARAMNMHRRTLQRKLQKRPVKQ